MEVVLGIAVIYVLYLIIKQEKNKSKNNRASRYSQPRQTGNNVYARKQASSSNQQTSFTRSSNQEDSDGLVTFTISFGREEEKSNNNKKAEWIKPKTHINIKGKTITGGYFYLGGKLPSLDGYSVDASLIDDKLFIRSEPMSYEDGTLGYWPKFCSISAGCRGAFIDWLASTRDQEVPLGYVFIYFYGIERRILIDSQNGEVDDNEFKALFSEIKRLQTCYGDSNSFNNYSTRLLEAMCILRPTVVSLDTEEFSNRYDALLFRYLLAKTVKAANPIPPKLALLWLQNTEHYRLRTPARRCEKEFTELFEIKYREKFSEGLVVKPNKTQLRLEYYAASSSLREVKLSNEDLPDPSGLKGAINKLIPIAELCTTELEPLSRYLAKEDASREDITALLSLPDELSNAVNSPFIASFKRWTETVLNENDGITTVNEFWKQLNIAVPKKINKKEAELMSTVCAKAEVGLAPDVNFHHAKPVVNGKIILFHTGHEKDFSPTKAFNEAAIVLRLGAMVAAADNHVHENELNALTSVVDNDSKLSLTEKRSLNAYLKWRLNSPADFNGLKAKIEKLSLKDKNLISHILISVALADGQIDSTEIKEIEKLYSKLGLDRSQVTSDIHQHSSSSAKAPKPQNQTESTSFSLNEELINLHESETQEVQGLLSSIFADDVEELDESLSTTQSEAKVSSDTLDDSHRSLLDTLITEEVWPRQAVEDLCQSLGLMIDGAIESINDWSYEKFDAPLLDDDGDIFIDQELVAEIQN